MFTPPRWLNALLRFMLRTPGLQRLVGRSTALLTFTGRKTGKSFTTPITYVADNGRVILTCNQHRQWWRNLADRPSVALRLAGKEVSGRAQVLRGPGALPFLIDFWQAQPMIAKRAGASFDDAGRIDPVSVEEGLAETVVVVVDVDD
jgi:deazaflavin-dependent oxidoreductase (nitroreductase family)